MKPSNQNSMQLDPNWSVKQFFYPAYVLLIILCTVVKLKMFIVALKKLNIWSYRHFVLFGHSIIMYCIESPVNVQCKTWLLNQNQWKSLMDGIVKILKLNFINLSSLSFSWECRSPWHWLLSRGSIFRDLRAEWTLVKHCRQSLLRNKPFSQWTLMSE